MFERIATGFTETREWIWQNVSNAARGAGQSIAGCAKQVGQGISHGAHTAGRAVAKGYIFAGRNIEDLTNKVLPPTAAKIVSSNIWGIPYTVGALLMPEIVANIATGLSCGLFKQLGYEIDEGMGKEYRQYAFIGLRNASIIRVGMHITTFALTQDWWELPKIISNIFMAVQTHFSAIRDTPEKIEPKTEQQQPQPNPA
jgi:hypothetical protein